MNTLILVTAAAILVLGLIICQLKLLGEKHPNAEMLARFYQIIAPK
jgi:hypothetical protein